MILSSFGPNNIAIVHNSSSNKYVNGIVTWFIKKSSLYFLRNSDFTEWRKGRLVRKVKRSGEPRLRKIWDQENWTSCSCKWTADGKWFPRNEACLFFWEFKKGFSPKQFWSKSRRWTGFFAGRTYECKYERIPAAS